VFVCVVFRYLPERVRNEISWIYSCVFVMSVRSVCYRAPCIPRTSSAVDIQPGRQVCCMLRAESRRSATIVPVHQTRYHPHFFCLCMCLIYSFIFTSFLLFLLSIVSSFLHPLYKSPSIHSSLTDSFSLFYLLFLSSISCVQFLPLFFFCSSLISFLLSLPLYLVFLLFLLTSLLSFILFCPCNLFVPVAAFLLFFFLLIFVTFSSFVFR